MATIRVKSANLLRRDTAANWSAKNPILREGEEGYETDTGKRKVGNGTTEWNNLKYDSGIVDQTYSPTSENAQSGKAVAEAIAQNTYTKISKIEISVDDFSQFDTSKVYIAANDIQVKYKKTSTAEFTTIDESTIYKNSLITFSSWIDTEYSTPEFLIIVSGRIISDNFVYCNAKYQFEDEVEGERFLAYEPLYFNPSPTDLRYFATSDNPQSGKAVAEAVSTEQNRADNTFSNTLKGMASGSAILIDDVSPVTHEMGVKVRGKNLFDKSNLKSGPYIKNLTQINKGFTFETNATNRTMAVTSSVFLSAGTYYFSGTVSSSDGLKGGGGVYDYDKKVFIINNAYRGTIDGSFTITESKIYGLNFYAPYNAVADVTVTFTDVQLELGTTATAYTPYVDPTSVTVGRCGKQLLPYPFTYKTLESNGVTFTDNKDGTITLNGQNNGTSVSTYNLFYTSDKLDFLKPNTDYYLSCNLDNIVRSLMTVKSDGTYKYYSHGNINFPTDETPKRLFIQIRNNDTTTYDNTVVKLQLELGTTATTYEPYIAPTEYIPTADGTVNGVTSLYPNTTLMTDTDGVIIYCEYNRDINKAFAALEAAIATNNS